MNILLVDDTEISLSMAKILIDHIIPSNYIEFAHNAQMAIDRAKVKQFDYIISDLCMPEMNGDELAKFIATQENLSKNAKIYICSSRNPKENEEKNLKLYSSGFIQKPLDTEKLKKIFSTTSSIEDV